MARRQLTKAELRIMQVVWEKRQATVSDVVAAMSRPSLAYTTVLTVLRLLELKGIVSHRKLGRAYVFSPRIERDTVAASALQDVLASFFFDRKTALAVQLISEERPSRDELTSIKALIARYEDGTDASTTL